MEKLNKIVFDVLSEYQDKDLRNENIRLEISSKIEERWKNLVKEVAKSVIMKKAVEQINNRINSGILTGPSDTQIISGKNGRI